MKTIKNDPLGDLFIRDFVTRTHCRENNAAKRNWPTVATLKRWNRLRTKSCLAFETEKEFLSHRFSVLREWIRQNEEYTPQYAYRLNKVIKALILDNHLNAEERNYVRRFNAIALEKNRTLKDLIVNFPKLPGEKVFYVIEQVKLHTINPTNGEERVLPQAFDAHLTNKAIVLHNSLLVFRIPFADTLSFKLTTRGIY